VKNLILHLGMDKTGTSAIQQFLHINREVLRKQAGLCYPQAGLWNDYSHHPFAFSIIEQNGYTKENISRLVKELESETQGAAKVLISSECLFKTPDHPNFPLFQNQLFTLFDHVSAVIYVRRQDLWLESRYKHSVKSGQEIPLHKLATPFFCDYFQFIENWARILGRENIVVQPYEKEQFLANSIFPDFLQAIGLKDREEFARPLNKVNDSLCNRGTAFKKLFNPLLKQAHLGDRLNQLLLAYAQISTPKQPASSLLSEKERARIIARYKPVNAHIARTYRPNGPEFLFLNNLPRPKLALFSTLTSQELIQIWDFIHQRDLLFFDALLTIAEREATEADSPDADNARALLAAFTGHDSPEQKKIPWLHPKKLMSRLLFSRQKASSLFYRLSSPLRGPKNVACPCDTAPRSSKGCLFLHIGIPKTGTSAIQNFLARHTTLLERNDFCYPLAGRGFVSNAKGEKTRTDAHHQLALALLSQSDPEGQARYTGPEFNDLLNAMRSESQHRANLVISSEVFYNSKILPRIHAFKRMGREIRVIVYCRAQHELLESAYAQRVKKNSCTTDLQSFISHELETNHSLEYDRFLSELASIFGTQNIIVRIYDRQKYPNQNVIPDFLQALDAGPDMRAAGLSTIDRSNPSLSSAAVLFKRELNRLGLSTYQDEALVATLLDYSSRCFPQEMQQNSLISPTKRAEIKNFFAASNSRFAQRFAPDIDPAWVEAEDPPPSPPLHYAALQTRDIAAIIKHLNNANAQLLTILYIQYIITYSETSRLDPVNASIFHVMQTARPHLDRRLVHDFAWNKPGVPRPHQAVTWLRFAQSTHVPADASSFWRMERFHVESQDDSDCVALCIPADENSSVMLIRLSVTVLEHATIRLFYQTLSDPHYSARHCVSRDLPPGGHTPVFFLDDPSRNGHIRLALGKTIDMAPAEPIDVLEIKLS
jgi:hypothetical protein